MISLFISNLVFAQYYFKDIINCKQTAEEMLGYKSTKIKKIQVKSYEPDGEISKDFYCEKKYQGTLKNIVYIQKTGKLADL